MDEILESYRKELETMTRILNAYLSTHPVLGETEVNIISIRKKDAPTFPSKDRKFHADMDDEREMKNADKGVNLRAGVICVDEFGKEYLWPGTVCPRL